MIELRELTSLFLSEWLRKDAGESESEECFHIRHGAWIHVPGVHDLLRSTRYDSGNRRAAEGHYQVQIV